MLNNAYLLAKNGADAAENDKKFAEILTKFRDVTWLSSTAGREDLPPRRVAKCPRCVRCRAAASHEGWGEEGKRAGRDASPGTPPNAM